MTMQFRRTKQPINAAIRTTVRAIENYRDRCLEVQTSSVNGSPITLSIFIDGKQCLEKSFTSSSEAKVLDRGMKFGMNLIDALEAEDDPVTQREARMSLRHDADAANAVRSSI